MRHCCQFKYQDGNLFSFVLFQDACLLLLGKQRIFFCVVTFLYLVSVLFFYLNSVLGPFFYTIPDLNVFDIFTRMGLLQESSNKCGVLSWLSTSAAGLWGFCLSVLLMLIPSRNQVWDPWLENASQVLRLVLERLVNLLSRTVTVLFHNTSIVALSPFYLLKPAGWQKHNINQTKAATDILGFL